MLVIFYFGCSSTKDVTVSPQEPESDKPIIWKQSYYPDLKIGDPILFFNSTEIFIKKQLGSETFLITDGKLKKTEEITNLIKTVSVTTSGKLVDMKKDVNGRIINMLISFSENDQTYLFDFIVASDGSFKLNGNARLVFEGKKYPAIASIKGDECKLMFIFELETNIENINEKAEGVSVSGTKIIPQK